jgi:sucrose-6-phosphate hydrolase SacC (GH32 family)
MRIAQLITTSLAIICSVVAARAQTLTARHLSETHTQVRVDAKDRFLLLPVQETAPEARVRVLSDLQEVQALNIRLAIDKVDYFVPFDLTPYSGKNLLLDVVMNQGRSLRRNSSDDVCWNEMKLSPVFDRSNVEYYRPTYHFSPDYGWMNDPNGMVYKDGEWHLFFQYNPYGSIWGNMHWGHAVSKDLMHWEQLGVAIAPDALGTIFSGSAVVDKDNVSGFGKDAIVAMYTSDGANQTQSIAYSNDGGRSFTKYAGNPVIVAEHPDFRDPNLFWDHHTRQWKVILAAGQEVQFWASDNLKDWTYESSFGTGYGNHNGVWECPDLLKMSLDGKEKYVLLLNINPGGPFGGSATQYFVGQYDGHQFTCDDLPTVIRWMDYGMDHYATVTWSNAPAGRTVALAWMSNWQYANAVPTQQFRSSNSIPRDLSLIRQDKEVLLKSSPAPEVEALRGTPRQFKLSSAEEELFDKPQKAYELVIRFNLPKKENVSFILSNESGEQVVMTYETASQTFSMDRRSSGRVSFSKFFPTVTVAPTRVGGKMELRLFLDSASIEAFGNDFCMTNLVFPTTPYNTLKQNGKVKADVTLYPLSK